MKYKKLYSEICKVTHIAACKKTFSTVSFFFEYTAEIATKQILDIRQRRELEKFEPKPKSIIKIDFNAQSWKKLIKLEDIEVEPPSTLHIPTFKLEEAMKTNQLQIQLPNFTNNSLSVERAVKLVSDASKMCMVQK